MEFTVRDGITEIAGEAFYGCTALARVTLPESLHTVQMNAFYDCTGLYALDGYKHHTLDVDSGNEYFENLLF
jgi:hypothetical protein